MTKLSIKSSIKPVIGAAVKSSIKPVIGAGFKSSIGDAIKKMSEPALRRREMEKHADQFLDMLRRNATLREVKSLKPMDGLTLITLVSKIEQKDRKKALLAMQSEGGKKTAIQRKKSAQGRSGKICDEARKFVKNGTSDRDLVSKLVRKFELSAPTIRKALKEGGLKK
jgi:hypothetical protein